MSERVASWRASPVFDGVREALEAFGADASFERPPPVNAWNERLAILGAMPVRFSPQPPRGRRRRAVDPSSLYDARIASGEVPSRPGNWHDFFNALVWASFPKSKVALHARQHAMIEERIEPGKGRLPGARTREQDVIAMLDEGGVVIVGRRSAMSAIDAAIAAADSAAMGALVARGDAYALVFGHALLEHVATRQGMVRALALALEAPDEPAMVLDGPTARTFADPVLAAHLADRTFLTERPPWPGLPIVDALFRAEARA